jgi:hypothetical protein
LCIWITLRYQQWNGKMCGHTTNIQKRSELEAILERYEVQPEDILTFGVDGREVDVEEVKLWITKAR